MADNEEQLPEPEESVEEQSPIEDDNEDLFPDDDGVPLKKPEKKAEKKEKPPKPAKPEKPKKEKSEKPKKEPKARKESPEPEDLSESDDEPDQAPIPERPTIPPGGGLLLGFLTFFALLEGTIPALLALALRFMIDTVADGADQVAYRLGLTFIAGGIAVALVTALLRGILTPKMVSRYVVRLRADMFYRLQRYGPIRPQVLQDRITALQNRFSQDIAPIETRYAELPGSFILPAVQIIACLTVIAILDWRAACVAAALVPWILIAPLPVRKKKDTADERVVLRLAKEVLTAQSLLKVFSLDSFRLEMFDRRNQSIGDDSAGLALKNSVFGRINNGGVMVLLAGTLLMSGFTASADNAALTGGGVAAIIVLSLYLISASGSIHGFRSVQAAATAARGRIADMVRERPEITDAPKAKALPPMQTEIGMLQVNFSYAPNAAKPVQQIKALTARVPKGTAVAFVGPASCGKSTVLKLLLRLLDPQAGAISIDGRDLRVSTQVSLRELMGVVFQDNPIFTGTIRDNIKLAMPEATAEMVAAAAKLAGVDEFVPGLPKGYETPIGEGGAKLAAGGVQRIALARALLRVPGILLLDEVTSPLDFADEKRLLETLEKLRENRTVIAFTHRLSTVVNYDHIFVMHQGQIVEQGSHEALVEAAGLYASWWRRQGGFAFSEDGRHAEIDPDILKTLPLIGQVDDELLQQMSSYFGTMNFAAGQEIVRQKDPGDRLCLLVRGKAEVWRTDEVTSKSAAVAWLSDGDSFGELPLLTGLPWTVSVKATTPCTVVSLERAHFARLMEGQDELARTLRDTASDRLRETNRALNPADWA